MESEHFKSAELRCRHCGREGVRRELLEPLKVSSAYCCPKHPVEARRPKPGFHTRGLAADVIPLAMSLRTFYDVVQTEPRIKGIGVDRTDGYIHVDAREASKPVFWVYRNGRAVVTKDSFQEVVDG